MGPECDALWRRLPLFTWVLIGPLDLAQAMGVLRDAGLHILAVVQPDSSFNWNFVGSRWYWPVATLVTGVVLLAMAALFGGREGVKLVAERLRWPPPIYALLGLAFPIVFVAAVSGAHYLVDWVGWATSSRAILPPNILLDFPRVPNPWLLLLFVPAFAEECVFRGLLQPCFIGRYGLDRGIFLSGLVWAAIHFHGDTYGTSVGSAAVGLGIRIGLCLTQTFVFAWLTLRSRSLVPSTIAHALYNLAVFSSVGPGFYGEREFVVVFWTLLAALLFRSWPPVAEAVGEFSTEASPQLA